MNARTASRLAWPISGRWPASGNVFTVLNRPHGQPASNVALGLIIIALAFTGAVIASRFKFAGIAFDPAPSHMQGVASSEQECPAQTSGPFRA
jgi:hypothetical protein